MAPTITTLTRDNYGALSCAYPSTTDADRALLRDALALAARAAQLGLIEAAYDSLERDRRGRWSGSARHHEAYDLTIKRGRVSQILLCIRETDGNKYGVSTTSKTYVILTRAHRAVEIQTANKALAAKAAKQAGQTLGHAIAVCSGAASLKANRMDLTTVFKRVAVRLDGHYFSIYDGKTEYRLGEEIREATRQDHNGGIYCYPTVREARAWEVPVGWPGHDLPQVVIRCIAGGSYCRYDNGKISVSRLTPVEVVA